jgi:3-oxoacyl-[acyl-carrier protein] reductase
MQAKKQTVLITGGSRGIGAACAKQFAASGYDVIILFRSAVWEAEQVVRTCRDFGVEAWSFQTDVGNLSRLEGTWLELMGQVKHPILHLINNAGIDSYQLFQDTNESDWLAQINVHFTGALFLIQKTLPLMRAFRFGRIINITSIWGEAGAACESIYSAAKGAMNSFTKSLAKELASTGITVNAVAPGAIETDMMARLSKEDLERLRAEIPMRRLGTPDEVAYWALVLADPRSSYLTGQVISPNGGWFT